MAKAFTIYNDPGHAWAKVPAVAITAVGLKANDFSRYSYVGDNCLYLEEDCDLGRFIEAYRATTGTDPKFTEKYCNGSSSIRKRHSNCSEAVRYFCPSIA